VDPPIGPGAAGRGVSPRRRTSLLGAVVAVLLAFVIGVLPLDLLGVADLVRTPLRSDFATEILPTAGRPVLAAVEHVARRAVEGRLAPIRPIDEQSAQFTRLGGLLAYNFLLIAGVFGVLGALVLLIRRGAIGTGILLLVLFAVAVAAGVVFPAIDLAGAMLPAWVIFALWVAAGTATLGRARLVWLGPVLAALVVVSPIVVYLLVPQMASSRGEFAQLAEWSAPASWRGTPAERLTPWRAQLVAPGETARAVLSSIESDAAVVVHEPAAQPLGAVLGYLQRVEGAAPGVDVRCAVSAGDTATSEDADRLDRTLAALIGERGGERAVYVASLDTLDATAIDGAAIDLLVMAESEVTTPLVTGEREPLRLAPRSDVLWQLVRSREPVPGTVAVGDVAAATTTAEAPGAADTTAQRPEGDVVTPLTFLAETHATVSPALHEADSLYALGSYWQAAAAYGRAVEKLGEGAARDEGDALPVGSAFPEPEALARYTVALSKSEMPGLSEEMRQRFVAMYPDSVRAHEILGTLFMQAGDPQHAVEELEVAGMSRPDDPALNLLLGEAHAELGNEAGAREHLRRTLAVEPDNGVALYRLGRVLEEAGDLEAAANVYRRYLDVEHGEYDAEVRERLATIAPPTGEQ
jgi:hypothetical protein